MRKEDSLKMKAPCLKDVRLGRTYWIERPLFWIGRDGCNDLVIADDRFVSRRHAVISKQSGKWRVRDLNSENGSFLNCRSLDQGEWLQDGDEVLVGNTTLYFCCAHVTGGVTGG